MTDHSTESDTTPGRPALTAVVTSVATSAEASIIVGLLEANGIPARSSADNAGGAYPGMGWVRVLVAPEDLEQAAQVLDSPF